MDCNEKDAQNFDNPMTFAIVTEKSTASENKYFCHINQEQGKRRWKSPTIFLLTWVLAYTGLDFSRWRDMFERRVRPRCLESHQDDWQVSRPLWKLLRILLRKIHQGGTHTNVPGRTLIGFIPLYFLGVLQFLLDTILRCIWIKIQVILCNNQHWTDFYFDF